MTTADGTIPTDRPRAREARVVVGLGTMGAGMAVSLLRAGHRVLGVDPGPVPTPPGVERTTLPEALAEARVAVLSLPGTEQVDLVMADVAGAREACLVIDASTCPPADTRRRADALARQAHVLVDAPVSGGASGAREGALTAFLGCPEEHLGTVLDVLVPLTAHVAHVGGVGAGNTAKLMNNLLCGIHLAAARSLHGVAAASGVEAERLLAAINTASGRSGVTEVNLPRWVLSGTFDSGFPVGLMARDVALAAEMTDELDASSPLTAAAQEMWARLREQIGPHEDFNRMVTAR